MSAIQHIVASRIDAINSSGGPLSLMFLQGYPSRAALARNAEFVLSFHLLPSSNPHRHARTGLQSLQKGLRWPIQPVFVSKRDPLQSSPCLHRLRPRGHPMDLAIFFRPISDLLARMATPRDLTRPAGQVLGSWLIYGSRKSAKLGLQSSFICSR